MLNNPLCKEMKREILNSWNWKYCLLEFAVNGRSSIHSMIYDFKSFIKRKMIAHKWGIQFDKLEKESQSRGALTKYMNEATNIARLFPDVLKNVLKWETHHGHLSRLIPYHLILPAWVNILEDNLIPFSLISRSLETHRRVIWQLKCFHGDPA